MADLNEHVAYLSQEIGPRPAGTEEEQRAALYISEQFSNEMGLLTTMEDFQCNPDSGLPRALLSGVSVAVTVLAVFLSVAVVPAIILDILCILLIAAEIFEKPILSHFLNRGVSQNVVAKYVPLRSTNRSSRRRKVVIVANYDSGKVRRDLSNGVVSALPAIYWVEFAAMAIMPVVLLIRFFMAPEGTALVAFDVLLGVLSLLAVLPVVSFVLEKLADYNEGANCNASGVAVMMEVAARVMASRDLPDMEEPSIHGEEAAVSAGLAPEGADLVYNAPSNTDELGSSMESAAQRLAAAKAAVAALSGKPVEETQVDAAAASPVEAPATIQEDASFEETAEPVVDIAATVAEPVVAPSVVPTSAPEPSVPDWFKKGQEQAKKPKVEKPAQRSRYAAALEHAEEEIHARATARKSAPDELSERMRGMRASVQAASAAAGATPTGVIPVTVAEQVVTEAPEPVPSIGEAAPPVPTSESVAAPADESASALIVDSAATPVAPPSTPAPAPAHAAPRAIAGDPEIASIGGVPDPAAPATSAPSAAPLQSVPPASLPHDDDPNISVRESRRPLTGSMSAVPEVLPDLSGVPTPANAASEAPASRRLVIPAVQGSPAGEEPVPAPSGRKRRAISLPQIGVSQELPRISMDERQQAAPLAEERPASDGRVHDLSAIVPSVAQQAADPAATIATPQMESALRGSMPSLAQTPADPSLSGSISLAGSFSSMGATGAAAPIGDELLENAAADDLYVEDIDDSAYREQVTETGAMAGPGYVEMPKSRFGRLFGRKRRKEQVQESTPQEWLNVEDDFEAQQVGASRGGWESFRQEDAPNDQTVAFTPDYFEEAFSEEQEFGYEQPRGRRRYEGGAFSLGEEPGDDVFEGEVPSEPVSPFAEGLPADFVFETEGAQDQIEQFHSQRVDIEVWFVALGAELAGNGGMRAFMDAHAAELKGSIIVDLEALGDGTLSLIEKEGTYLPKKASSRMKRLAKKAGQAVGLAVPSETMEWRNSTAAYALKHGQQAMHLAGMNGKKPAFFAQADDVIENLDPDKLALNSDFVMELLKHI